MARSVKPPADFGAPARHLWRSCLARDDSLAESDNPMRDVLLNACRLSDQIEAMQRTLTTEGLQVDTATGPKAHPMLGEQNKAMSLQARLLTALRMPDESTGQKPQRRGMRAQGPSKPGGRKSSSVSSLDRARRHAVGA